MGWMRMGGLAVALLVTLAPRTGRAQAETMESYDEEIGLVGPVVWNIGGTLAVPLGDAADRVNVGGGFAVGLTYNVAPTLGIQFEYGADWASLDTGQFAGVGINGDSLLQYFNLNAFIRPTHAGRVGFYLIAGGGLYYRGAEVTRVEGTALAPYCDPWLYYCSVVPVTASSLIGSRSSWDWGLDGGVGVTFALSPQVRMYIEGRYHYIFGPSFTDVTGDERNADGQFLPITLGLRF